jgi:DNA polymerase III subunit delta'
MPFRDVIDERGHRRLIDLLARSIARDTLPPSLIFAGPAESDARAAAIAVAQALNCVRLAPESRIPSPESWPDACGTCTACLRIARGVHPDVLVVEPGDTGTIKIEQVREIVERAAYRPFEGRRRVVIVSDADALVPQAQNALLKTLEEPPSSSIFILVTSRPDMLLETVRSRCIRLQFAESGTPPVDADAREIAQHVLAQAADDDEPARRLEGVKDLLTNTGGGNSAAEDREQVASYLRAMESLLRDVEVLATRADDRALANPDVRPALERLAPAYGGERGVRAFTAIDRALMALDRNAGVKVVADWVVLQL